MQWQIWYQFAEDQRISTVVQEIQDQDHQQSELTRSEEVRDTEALQFFPRIESSDHPTTEEDSQRQHRWVRLRQVEEEECDESAERQTGRRQWPQPRRWKQLSQPQQRQHPTRALLLVRQIQWLAYKRPLCHGLTWVDQSYLPVEQDTRHLIQPVWAGNPQELRACMGPRWDLIGELARRSQLQSPPEYESKLESEHELEYELGFESKPGPNPDRAGSWTKLGLKSEPRSFQQDGREPWHYSKKHGLVMNLYVMRQGLG